MKAFLSCIQNVQKIILLIIDNSLGLNEFSFVGIHFSAVSTVIITTLVKEFDPIEAIYLLAIICHVTP